MTARPTDEWRRRISDEQAEVAAGLLAADDATAADLWPVSLLTGTDAALDGFEDELHVLSEPDDAEVMAVVEHVVLALNKVNGDELDAGRLGYETGEREELCGYIEASLEDFSIDIGALASRLGISRHEITDKWRKW
jgi:hypothetical protein